MTEHRPYPTGPAGIRRRAVRLGDGELTPEPLLPGEAIPQLLRAETDGLLLAPWAGSRRERLVELLRRHGALLFRGFVVEDVAGFERFVDALFGSPLSYEYRSTPRTEVAGRVFTSTEYPADQTIPMHNEMSYTRRWPLSIAFHCIDAADEGGETPIADSRRVLAAVDPEIRRRFAEHGVLYVRNFGGDLDLGWEEVFQTDDRSEVERYCREAGIEWEWRPDGGLRTRQVCQAVADHPVTGETVWFNQAHLFHVTRLPEDVRDELIAQMEPEDLPRNTYFGDGSEIPRPVLDQVEEAFASATVAFSWQDGDVMLLDNMLIAHGRRPFRGSRRVVVSMAEGAGS